MDTPELNRPFDSMYLGKRELGHCDTSGGRLSVAQANTHRAPLGYDKRRSFDRGPGGYGGLGPSPFDGLGLSSEEETALPHIPTPEHRSKHQKSKVGVSLGSKRMVSNFLRSRRKGIGGSEEAGASHEENIGGADETPAKGSPLFI